LVGILRMTGRVVAWLAIGLVGLLLGTIAVNSFDETPAPDAAALLRPPPNPYTPPENIYVALAGFDAPSGRSAIDAGQIRIESYNRQLDALIADPTAVYAPTTNPQRLAFKGNIDFCRESSLLSEIQTHKRELVQLFADNREPHFSPYPVRCDACSLATLP
jgi:hypothetical protein